MSYHYTEAQKNVETLSGFAEIHRALQRGFCFVSYSISFSQPIKISNFENIGLACDRENGVEIPIQDCWLTIDEYGDDSTFGYRFLVSGNTQEGKPVRFTIGIVNKEDRHTIHGDSCVITSESRQDNPEKFNAVTVKLPDPEQLPALSRLLPPYGPAVKQREDALRSLKSDIGKEGRRDQEKTLPGASKEQDNPARYWAEALEKYTRWWGAYQNFSNPLEAGLNGEWVSDLHQHIHEMQEVLARTESVGVSGLDAYREFIDSVRKNCGTYLKDLIHDRGHYAFYPRQEKKT